MRQIVRQTGETGGNAGHQTVRPITTPKLVKEKRRVKKANVCQKFNLAFGNYCGVFAVLIAGIGVVKKHSR
ncbi:hypothetical protein [Paraburkholderia acidisoli]|uniref:hypothetical protein n=1 Tax=Paraburkholderia acidisoli TaxID=2571748 RepID=UPI001E62A906|nr:hypothetical protein [Paraburkholderia acidisoli]